MSALKSIYALHEVVTDENGEYIREYDKDLPHSDEIAEIFIREWNGFAGEMLKIMNDQAGRDRIESCLARRYKKNGRETQVVVEIKAKKGQQFRSGVREDIFDFMSSQFSDGWGEGFFKRQRIAKDGTRYYIE